LKLTPLQDTNDILYPLIGWAREIKFSFVCCSHAPVPPLSALPVLGSRLMVINHQRLSTNRTKPFPATAFSRLFRAHKAMFFASEHILPSVPHKGGEKRFKNYTAKEKHFKNLFLWLNTFFVKNYSLKKNTLPLIWLRGEVFSCFINFMNLLL
jgi:hypothetical protein